MEKHSSEFSQDSLQERTQNGFLFVQTDTTKGRNGKPQEVNNASGILSPLPSLKVSEKSLICDYHDTTSQLSPFYENTQYPVRNTVVIPKKAKYALNKQKMLLHPGTKTIEEVFMLRKLQQNSIQDDPYNGRTIAQQKQRLYDLGLREGTTESLFRAKYSNVRPKTTLTQRPSSVLEIQELKQQFQEMIKRLEELEEIEKTATNRKHPNTVDSTNQIKLHSAQPIILRNQLRLFEEALKEKDKRKNEELPKVDNHLVFAVDDIEDKINRLFETCVTDDSDEIKLKETRAATMCSRLARGFICRAKYKRAQKGLKRWNERNGLTIFLRNFEKFVRHQNILQQNIDTMIATHDERVKDKVFQAFSEYIKNSKAAREKVLERAEVLKIQMQTKLIETVFIAWVALATGSSSRKNIAKMQKERYEAVRQQLEERNERIGKEQLIIPITKQKIIEILKKEAIRIISSNREYMCKKIHFKAWHRDGMFQLNQWNLRAKRFRYMRIMPAYLQAWKECIVKMQREAAVNAEWRLNRFEQKHNNIMIENFWRIKMLNNHFITWKSFAQKSREVRIRFKAIINKQRKYIFDAWVEHIKFQLQVKKLVIEEWRSQCVTMREVPFKKWYIWVCNRKKRKENHAYLCAAFVRRRKRLLITQMFRVWKHKAIYGKTEAMFSRAELIKALEIQKKHVLAMEVMSRQLKDTIKELEGYLEKERELTREFKITIAQKDEDLLERSFSQEKLEGEIIRLQSILDSVTLLHPGTMRRLTEGNNNDEKEEREKIEEMGFTKATRNAAATRNIGKNDDDDDSNHSSLIPSQHLRRSKRSLENLQAPIRPLSARIQKKTMHNSVNERGSNFPVVWVTQDDSKIILRVEWAKKMLKQCNFLNAGSNENFESGEQHKPETIENRYRSILSFILTGDLESEEENKEEEEKGEKKQTDATTDSKKPRFSDESLNWNDFIQCLTREFPLRHPANSTPKDKVNMRIMTAKASSRNKRFGRDKNTSNIYKESR